MSADRLGDLLLLWAEPFRIGDEIKLDSFEGSVEEIQTRATFIKTYDGKRVVIESSDGQQSQSATIEPAAIVNATGAWVDATLANLPASSRRP